MASMNGLSCNDLKFRWKIEPIRKEEEKLRVQIRSEECAIQRLVAQREAPGGKTTVNDSAQTASEKDGESNNLKGVIKVDDNRQETVLRLRCERRRKKLSSLHTKKLDILWSFVKEWSELEVNRLSLETCIKNDRSLGRLTNFYSRYPREIADEEDSWKRAEEVMRACRVPNDKILTFKIEPTIPISTSVEDETGSVLSYDPPNAEDDGALEGNPIGEIHDPPTKAKLSALRESEIRELEGEDIINELSCDYPCVLDCDELASSLAPDLGFQIKITSSSHTQSNELPAAVKDVAENCSQTQSSIANHDETSFTREENGVEKTEVRQTDEDIQADWEFAKRLQLEFDSVASSEETKKAFIDDSVRVENDSPNETLVGGNEPNTRGCNGTSASTSCAIQSPVVGNQGRSQTMSKEAVIEFSNGDALKNSSPPKRPTYAEKSRAPPRFTKERRPAPSAGKNCQDAAITSDQNNSSGKSQKFSQNLRDSKYPKSPRYPIKRTEKCPRNSNRTTQRKAKRISSKTNTIAPSGDAEPTHSGQKNDVSNTSHKGGIQSNSNPALGQVSPSNALGNDAKAFRNSKKPPPRMQRFKEHNTGYDAVENSAEANDSTTSKDIRPKVEEQISCEKLNIADDFKASPIGRVVDYSLLNEGQKSTNSAEDYTITFVHPEVCEPLVPSMVHEPSLDAASNDRSESDNIFVYNSCKVHGEERPESKQESTEVPPLDLSRLSNSSPEPVGSGNTRSVGDKYDAEMTIEESFERCTVSESHLNCHSFSQSSHDSASQIERLRRSDNDPSLTTSRSPDRALDFDLRESGVPAESPPDVLSGQPGTTTKQLSPPRLDAPSPMPCEAPRTVPFEPFRPFSNSWFGGFWPRREPCHNVDSPAPPVAFPQQWRAPGQALLHGWSRNEVAANHIKHILRIPSEVNPRPRHRHPAFQVVRSGNPPLPMALYRGVQDHFNRQPPNQRHPTLQMNSHITRARGDAPCPFTNYPRPEIECRPPPGFGFTYNGEQSPWPDNRPVRQRNEDENGSFFFPSSSVLENSFEI